MMGKNGDHMEIFIVEYQHLKNTKYPLFHWEMIIIQ